MPGNGPALLTISVLILLFATILVVHNFDLAGIGIVLYLIAKCGYELGRKK